VTRLCGRLHKDSLNEHHCTASSHTSHRQQLRATRQRLLAGSSLVTLIVKPCLSLRERAVTFTTTWRFGETNARRELTAPLRYGGNPTLSSSWRRDISST